MKKILSFILCVCIALSLFALSSCGKSEKPESVELKFISEPITGYEWRVFVSRENIVEVEERFEEDPENKDDPQGGWQIYTVTPVGEGEVTLDFIYTSPGVDKVDLSATYIFIVDKDLNIREKYREGSYFDLDNVVPQNKYIIRLDVDNSGNMWQYKSDPDGIVEISYDFESATADEEANGKKGEQIFTVIGMNKGKATVNFTYEDKDGENVTNDAVYVLEVDDDLIVSEVKHSGKYFKEEE